MTAVVLAAAGSNAAAANAAIIFLGILCLGTASATAFYLRLWGREVQR